MKSLRLSKRPECQMWAEGESYGLGGLVGSLLWKMGEYSNAK